MDDDERKWTPEELAAGRAWRRQQREAWRASPEGRRELRRRALFDVALVMILLAVVMAAFLLVPGEKRP